MHHKTVSSYGALITTLALVLGIAGCSSKTESTEGMSGTIAAASRFQEQQVNVADVKVDEKAQQVQDACAAAEGGASAKMASCSSGADKDVDSALNGAGNKAASKSSKGSARDSRSSGSKID